RHPVPGRALLLLTRTISKPAVGCHRELNVHPPIWRVAGLGITPQIPDDGDLCKAGHAGLLCGDLIQGYSAAAAASASSFVGPNPAASADSTVSKQYSGMVRS